MIACDGSPTCTADDHVENCVASWVEPPPVRDLAQAIADGEAFTDADAILVARAYLRDVA